MLEGKVEGKGQWGELDGLGNVVESSLELLDDSGCDCHLQGWLQEGGGG